MAISSRDELLIKDECGEVRGLFHFRHVSFDAYHLACHCWLAYGLDASFLVLNLDFIRSAMLGIID